ncbi:MULTISPECIES: MOSC domain-containing protein [Cyanophyceae]|uniref:MOSC domain-containing protein n=1 Tax=Cyanophyceae TaxID=3028117 RepID=UPI0016855209|nr:MULTISPECIES: MOSC domain-containing protein [Cyanophyceae]MBD1914703.1 MOSC domain-containing protein [Phormidium sp. FACHB-77]MBD2032591.1 MOSC domain-containing protein [Phormidium sp. FACHB-322]MBD2049449.1 MOSC domain-containing protein [Leptolyngbya sp. FACHB-60]
MPELVSIQVGLPQTLGTETAADPMDQPWITGFFKQPIAGEVWVGSTHLAGDGQADLKNHGGVDKAVLAYSAEHYPDWRSYLHNSDLPYGGFGENFTVAGQTEAEACIGDIYAIGSARVQVSQPRQPCWKLSRRWRVEDLALQVKANGRSGWYFRVLQEGTVEPGLAITLCDRPYPEWTVARANRIMHHDLGDRAAAIELASCPLLSRNWQEKLLKRGASS